MNDNVLSIFRGKKAPTVVASTFVEIRQGRLNICPDGKLYITSPVKTGTAEEQQWAEQIRKVGELLTAARVVHEVFTHKSLSDERLPDTIVLDLSSLQQ
jgi:hypothetical protein